MQLTLYSKPGCHLCDDLKADLAELQSKVGFALIEYNIEENAEMFERFRYLIPVLDIENGPLLYAPINRVELMRVLNTTKAIPEK
ncbi:glutaredoxin family protein [Chloroflexi bacterium TSY]|nr:glutaredoxin family protein [Chloroflexi bacterium TSY]